MDNIDAIEQKVQARRLNKVRRPIKTARSALYLFAAFFTATVVLFSIIAYYDPAFMVRQMCTAIVYVCLGIASYRFTFVAFAIATLFTVFVLISNFPEGDSIHQQVTVLFALVIIVVLFRGLLSALNHDQLKEVFKDK